MSLLSGIMENPLIIVAAAIGVVGVGIIVWMNKKDSSPMLGGGKPGKGKIIVLQTRDKRAYELPIKKERELTLETVKDGIPRRYYKAGPGYTLPNGSTLFFGLEGTAYTALPRDDKAQSMGLPAALKSLWGNEAYDKMPKALKEPLEKHGFGVTIYPEKIADEDKYPHINVENISDEKKEKLVGYVAKAIKDEGKMDWKTMLLGAALGLVVGIMLVSFKVIKLA